MREHRIRKLALTVLAILAVPLLMASSCESEPTAAEQRREARDAAVAGIVAGQDLNAGTHSPTFDTIQFWLDTWSHEQGKLSFVYFSDAEGDMLGYYVLEGLPVSYCTAGTPPYDFENRDAGSDKADILVPAPALDGVWYSGAECNRYYAKEAVTGAFLDWIPGLGINQFLKDRPIRGLDYNEVKPFTGGETTVEEAEAASE